MPVMVAEADLLKLFRVARRRLDLHGSNAGVVSNLIEQLENYLLTDPPNYLMVEAAARALRDEIDPRHDWTHYLDLAQVALEAAVRIGRENDHT